MNDRGRTMPSCQIIAGECVAVPQYVVSTYDLPEEGEPVESGWEFGWRKRLMCDGKRAMARAVRHFESQGYDRDMSIYVEPMSAAEGQAGRMGLVPRGAEGE